MQERSSYLHENGLRRSLQRSPAVFRSQVSEFQQWLLSGMVNPIVKEAQLGQVLTIAPRTMLVRINAVTRFLNFCVTHNTESLDQIGPSVIAKLQGAMVWQLGCKEGRPNKRLPLESQRSIERCSNGECGGVNSYIRIRRLHRGSIFTVTSPLRTVFVLGQLRG